MSAKLLILLAQPPQCKDYRHVPLSLVRSHIFHFDITSLKKNCFIYLNTLAACASLCLMHASDSLKLHLSTVVTRT